MKPFSILSAALMVFLMAANAQASETRSLKDVKTLQVTGVGEIEIMPDQFVISGAVIKQEPVLVDAMNAMAGVVNQVQASLPKINGLETSDFNFASVNTTGVKDPACLLFNQEADRTNSTLRDKERRVRKKICEDVTQQASVTFTYTGSPVHKAGDAISKLAEAGAVRVRLNGYKISNLEEIELQAGERAVANARNKADRLAAAGGSVIVGVKDLTSYVPTYQQQVATAPRVNTYGAGETTRILKDTIEDKTVTAMNLKPGPQVISASVSLEFIYE